MIARVDEVREERQPLVGEPVPGELDDEVVHGADLDGLAAAGHGDVLVEQLVAHCKV